MRRRGTALLAASLIAVLTGCASVSGTATPAEVDIRTLDVGPYPTEPYDAHDDPKLPDFYEMYKVAGMRIADYVVNSHDIDPQMIYGKRASTVSAGLLPQALGNDIALEPVAKKHKMLYGFESNGASADATINSPSTWPSKKDTTKFTATTMVLQFPDAAAATAAAREFHDVDLAAQEGRNQPVSLPKYPAALSHWRPDAPFLRTVMPHGPYVIAFLLSVPTPDLAGLTTMAETAYTKQIESLAKTTPLTDEEVMSLPWDPDRLVARTLNPEELSNPDGSGTLLVTGKHGVLHYSGDALPSDRQYVDQQLTAMKAEQVALSWGSIGIRTPDPSTAQRAVADKLFPWRTKAEAAAPPNVPDAVCVENQSLATKTRFSCMVAYNQYVGIVGGHQLLDAHQRAAAQYALFANTR
ncbi:hypothetical protein [Nocardia sp. NPDC050717]|uniref:DUF7373 family lipoprotein n=1 Tax=Nocardia sp. NPDC050717 TaxID=3157221 RepID=UPI0033E0AF02